MRPGSRRRRPWWRRWLPRAWHPWDDTIVALAVVCAITLVLWALSVLVP